MVHDTPASGRQPGIDTTVPHSARIWNHWLGGKDNYPVDREAGDRFLEVYPGMVDVARSARHFLARTVRHLAEEENIRQFLDVGTGLPTVDNTHEVAQRVAPGSRIVYVDNDPLVLVHARALLTSAPEGATAYVAADARDPDAIVRHAAGLLDLDRPVALMMLGIMGHIPDAQDPWSLARRLLDALPPGSHLVLSDGADVSRERAVAHDRYAESGGVPYHLCSPARIGRFFDGLELLDPGVVPVSLWRPEPGPFGTPEVVTTYGAVARKP
ncbi:SAM-dependent methyltransferase [Spirillospora sp. NBC_01491]|uniref:SAM-dependent methyltransferase n=1 Tax=Spirillospora sp. NBC_01491 TaxID=2976007 RepID=UPI002E3202B0|nr:SAM-dependent methyltransferase [Spirillospora sp. NBC_01491]